MPPERMTLYVSEHCAYCQGAEQVVRQLSREFGVPYDVVSTDVTPVQGLPGVPAVYHRGVLYVGARFPQRLRLALLDQRITANDLSRLAVPVIGSLA